MSVMNRIRQAGSLPGVRKLVLHPPVRRAIANVLMVRFVRAAWLTTTPVTLIRREYLSRGSVAQYRLAGTESTVWLKHGRDLEALYALIYQDEYAPPAELRSRLDKPGLRTLDIGGNIGMFSAWVLLHWPDAQITAFEPAPDNVDLFRRWAAGENNPPQLLEAAATNADGTVTFADGLGSGSHVSTDGSGITVPAVDVLPLLQDADFVKIDIEGGEWAILTDPRLAQCRNLTLVMEYHRQQAPFLPAREAAVQVLTAAGFTTGYGESNYWGHGTLWAWKD